MPTIADSDLDTLVKDLDCCYEEGNEIARMAPAALAAARAAGVFTMTVPPDPCELPELMYVLRRVAWAEPGVAWSAANSTVFGSVAARVGDEARAALMAQVDSGPLAFSGVPGQVTATDDGYLLDGSWPFVTGIDDADLAVLVGRVGQSRPPDVRFCVVDPVHARIGSAWNTVAGMRTTGSNSVDASGLVLGPDRAVRLSDEPMVDDPLYRLPMFPYFLGTGVAVLLGVFRRGVEEAIELIAGKVSSIDHKAAAELAPTQLAMTGADAALRACEDTFAALVDRMWAEVIADGSVSPATRGTAYSTFPFVVDTAVGALGRLYSAATTQAWPASSRVHRALTDLHVLSIGFARPRGLELDAARVLVGRDPVDPTF